MDALVAVALAMSVLVQLEKPIDVVSKAPTGLCQETGQMQILKTGEVFVCANSWTAVTKTIRPADSGYSPASMDLPTTEVQLSFELTPKPMGVLRRFNTTAIGPWTARTCNDGSATTRVPVERLMMTLPSEIDIIEPAEVVPILEAGVGRSKKAIVVDLLTYGGMIAVTATGFGAVAATPQVVASIAIGVQAANTVKDILRAKLPSVAEYQKNMLDGELELKGGECKTRIVFAARMKTPRKFSTKLAVPVRP